MFELSGNTTWNSKLPLRIKRIFLTIDKFEGTIETSKTLKVRLVVELVIIVYVWMQS